MIYSFTLAAFFLTFLLAPFTARAEEAFVSGLPVIEINTQDSADITSKEIYVNMTFTLTDPGNPENNIAGKTGRIRGRGNNTWISIRAKKKSYRVKFKGKTSLFGLEAASSWVLLAQHRDETLLYNAVAFELGNRFGFRFNHSFNFVDVYINGEYKGNYLLTEHNQAGAGRADIDRKQGWFAEIDEYYDKEPKFRTAGYDLPVMIKWPRPVCRDIANPAFNALKNDLNALTAALASPDFPENGYRDMIDIRTFIDFLMVNELVANTDLSHPRSTFIYKDKGGAISMGPLWDFDSGYGWNYLNWLSSAFNDHFNFPDRRPPVHDFFKRFYEDPVFLAKYKERWNEMRGEIALIPEFIGKTADKLEKSADKNFQHWWYKTQAPFTDTRFAQPNDFRAAIKRLENWYNARVFYLNLEFNSPDILPKAKDFGTAAGPDYPGTLLQTFTLVSYGEVSELAVRMHKGVSSAFEPAVSGNLAQTSTGNGGYITPDAISVRPKTKLPPAAHHDTLILTGSNQGAAFTLKTPIDFTVTELAAAKPPLKTESGKPAKWRRKKRTAPKY